MRLAQLPRGSRRTRDERKHPLYLAALLFTALATAGVLRLVRPAPREQLVSCPACPKCVDFRPSVAPPAAAPEPPLLPHYAQGFTPGDAPEKRLWRTADMQAAIAASQNPANCTAATYMRLMPVSSGIGSTLHGITAYLALAIERGQVLILHPNYGGGWVRGEYCDGECSYECFFEPLSRCAPGGVPPAGARVVDAANENVVHSIPRAWHDAFKRDAGVEAPDTPTRDVKYWWRAQGAAYVMRLNSRTAAHLAFKRRALATEGHVPLPLPPDTYAVHVRHGDKHQEMKLYDAAKFLRAISAAGNGTTSAPRTVFISTEDPAVIAEAQAVSAAAPAAWRVLVVPWERDNAATLAAATRGADETLHALLNLWISLEATHFVGQLGSNWCRLTDEP